MDWEDTFLSNGKLLEIFGIPDFTERQGREKQAEVSFKAGRDSFLDDVGNATIPLSEACKAGRREVVEWFRANVTNINGHPLEDLWKDQLEEWGINGD